MALDRQAKTRSRRLAEAMSYDLELDSGSGQGARGGWTEGRWDQRLRGQGAGAWALRRWQRPEVGQLQCVDCSSVQ